MSPEQAAGDPLLDGGSDQYSMACVMYEALAGVSPFIAADPRKALALRLLVDPVPLRAHRPELPAHVVASISKAMARLPNERWPSVTDFWHELSRAPPARA